MLSTAVTAVKHCLGKKKVNPAAPTARVIFLSVEDFITYKQRSDTTPNQTVNFSERQELRVVSKLSVKRNSICLIFSPPLLWLHRQLPLRDYMKSGCRLMKSRYLLPLSIVINPLFKYYEKLWYSRFVDIKTKALQEQIDACPHGIRTKENMKALGTLLYTYAIQNDLVDKNYASFIYIDRSTPKKRRGFFTLEERYKLWKNVGSVPNTELVLCLMYTGLRPNEFLKIKVSDYHGDYIVGGSKTEKGMNRVITL